MGQRFHGGFTAAEKTELWDRRKRGESLKAIGRAFGKPSWSIYFLVAPHGGIRPAQRRRSRLALTLAEREVISRGVTAHQSARSIAKLRGRSLIVASRWRPKSTYIFAIQWPAETVFSEGHRLVMRIAPKDE
jgi:IS30 family transposase